MERLGFGSDVDMLESYVASLQDSAADGNPLVQDPVYDQYFRLLKEVKPESEVITRNWEKDSDKPLDSFDSLLQKFGMRSIRTCTVKSDIDKYIETVSSGGVYREVCASFKLNGHACRVVYNNGDLIRATTRGRSKKGRDITRHLQLILGKHNEYLESLGLVEIRGELIVTYSDFNKTLSSVCKTPLSSVTSLVRDSASDAEIEMLHFLAYKILTAEDSLYDSLFDEMEALTGYGFETPYHKTYLVKNTDNIMKILKDFEDIKLNKGYEFDTDGIVIGINNNSKFYSYGLDGNAFKANIAVKMGFWECNNYSSTIRNIVFEHGKKWFTPKAEIDPVVTVTGAEVRVVPIYNVGVMNKLGLIPGATIHFRFGGETGVQLLTPDGNSVTTI